MRKFSLQTFNRNALIEKVEQAETRSRKARRLGSATLYSVRKQLDGLLIEVRAGRHPSDVADHIEDLKYLIDRSRGALAEITR